MVTYLRILFTGFLLAVLFPALGQKITEGVVEYNITYSGLSADMKKNEDLLPKTMSLYFQGEKCKLELHTIVGNTDILSNARTKESYVLMDMMGKKVAIKAPAEVIDSLTQPKVEFLKGKTKVAGYTCKRARITLTVNEDPFTFECSYTEDLPNMTSAMYPKFASGINGMLLEFDVMVNGMHMHMKADKVEAKKFDPKGFDVPPDYQIVTQEQMGQ